jgi:hypothetical protein
MDKRRRNLEENESMKSRWLGFRPWQRHSTILMVTGILFVLVGLSYVYTKTTPAREISLAAVLRVAPMEFWGWVFVAVGLMSIISTKWPPLSESWGYMALTGLSSGWGATYLTGMIFFHAPWLNLTQVMLWGCLAFLWWAISGLLNPDHMVVTEDGRR